MSPDSHASHARHIWAQLPFFGWLIALWMLLWGQFTWLAFFSGLIVAIVVTRIFRLPLYLHVIGVRNEADVEHQRRAVLGWEARIVRAVGSREQLRVIRAATIDTPRQGGATV